MAGQKRNIMIAFVVVLTLISIVVPFRVSAKVKQITDAENKLEGINEEEKAVLKELFSINQKIEELETQAAKINVEISALEKQLIKLEKEIADKQKDYDTQLDMLKQVLVDYQRGGPSTYLEILLNADNLSSFLKSLNVIKDISHNVDELLVSLEDGKKELEGEKENLDAKKAELEKKKAELTENLNQSKELQGEKEAYLASLKENEAFYSDQLQNLETMWADCQTLYPKLANQITATINDGYFTWDDLNMTFGLLNMSGYIEEDTFNGILKENTQLSGTEFHFEESQVVLQVPEEHLVLKGYFIIEGQSAIQFEVKEGTFFDLPLEQASIDELFINGPMLIDFNLISEGIIAVDFSLDQVESQEGKLAFEITPIW